MGLLSDLGADDVDFVVSLFVVHAEFVRARAITTSSPGFAASIFWYESFGRPSWPRWPSPRPWSRCAWPHRISSNDHCCTGTESHPDPVAASALVKHARLVYAFRPLARARRSEQRIFERTFRAGVGARKVRVDTLAIAGVRGAVDSGVGVREAIRARATIRCASARVFVFVGSAVEAFEEPRAPGVARVLAYRVVVARSTFRWTGRTRLRAPVCIFRCCCIERRERRVRVRVHDDIGQRTVQLLLDASARRDHARQDNASQHVRIVALDARGLGGGHAPREKARQPPSSWSHCLVLRFARGLTGCHASFAEVGVTAANPPPFRVICLVRFRRVGAACRVPRNDARRFPGRSPNYFLRHATTFLDAFPTRSVVSGSRLIFHVVTRTGMPPTAFFRRADPFSYNFLTCACA
jgi:hypothetical protein